MDLCAAAEVADPQHITVEEFERIVYTLAEQSTHDCNDREQHQHCHH